MTRAITTLELAALRGDGQFSKLYLALHQPSVVFQAQLATAPSSNDGVVSLAYENETGVYTDILPHQTLFVGSGSTGSARHDKGILRVRKAATDTLLYIGETSKIAWEVGDYLTVVDEFSPFQRHLRIDAENNNTVYMDYDLAYTDQHENFNPVPVMGSHSVGWLNGGSVDIPFDATGAWTLEDTLASYVWTSTGGTIDDDTSATPIITFDTAGTYRVSLTVTGVNGKSSTGHRIVFIYDEENPPFEDFSLTSLDASYDGGGWQFEINAFGDLPQSTIRDEALVILFSRDWYQNDEMSLGPVEGRANILALGWVDGETISIDDQTTETIFTVKGPHFWLNKMPGYPTGVEDTQLPQDGVDPSWTAIADLTLDKGMFHLLYWRSTIPFVCDVFPSEDGLQMGAVEAPLGSLWQQILTLAYESILAKPLFNRYGQMFFETDAQFMPLDRRTSYPVVQEITTADWHEKIMFMRRPVDECAYLEVSGVAYVDGVGTPICTRAYGTVLEHHGRVERRERLALEDASQAIELTGLIMGQLNNEYPEITVRLASNHRFFDLAPRQYATFDEISLRGEGFSGKAIPRRLSYTFEEGALLCDVVFEAESFPTNAVLVACPEFPDLPPLPPLDEPPPWPEVPPGEAWNYLVVVYDLNRTGTNPSLQGVAGIYVSDDFFTALQPNWYEITGGFAVQHLSHIKKIVGVVESASKIVMYALVNYQTYEGSTFRVHTFIYRMNNLLLRNNWQVIYQKHANLGEDHVFTSIAASNYNPAHFVAGGYQIISPIWDEYCGPYGRPSPPGRGGLTASSNNYGDLLRGNMRFMNVCECYPTTRDHCENMFSAGIEGLYNSNSYREKCEVVCDPTTGKVLYIFDTFSYTPSPYLADPDVDGNYFRVLLLNNGALSTKGNMRVDTNNSGQHDPFTGSAYYNGEVTVSVGQNKKLTSSNDGVTWVEGAFGYDSNNTRPRLQSVDYNEEGLLKTIHDHAITDMYAQCIHHVPYLPDYWVVGGTSKNGFTRNALHLTSDGGSTWLSKVGPGLPINGLDIRYLQVLAVPI